MNILKFKDHCCGCAACQTSCPVGAISMTENKQGFCYPVVDRKTCINCGVCADACAFNAEKKEKNHLLGAFAAMHEDETVRAASRSGGIFTALSDIVLEENGVIYGCKLVDNRSARHVRAVTKEERDALRGSKYIQSSTEEIFSQVKHDLEQGRKVLFSGTACQVDALHRFCGDKENLLLVDVVCHGVPSPKVWRDYLRWLCSKEGKTVRTVDFRDKGRFGWTAHKETVTFADGSIYSGDVFKTLFYSHYILRKDCFSCPYRNLQRPSDITIADCWGIAKHYPEFFDDKGISLVLLNTEKGKAAFDALEEVRTIPVEIEKVLQPPLKENWAMPRDYEAFWREYGRRNFGKILGKYVDGKRSPMRRALSKLKRLAGKACKELRRQ